MNIYKSVASMPSFLIKSFVKAMFRWNRFSEYLKLLVDTKYYQNAELRYKIFHFSQESEDLILKSLFINKEKGFYVDIGAHHPIRFSNTYMLYCQGWRGINVDSMPGSMAAFKEVRTRDINLELGVSCENGEREFHIFEEPALNTFDAELAKQRIADGWKLKCVAQCTTKTINSILETYLPEHVQIDLLTIDIEGLDELVLCGLDFSRYRPAVIVCEILDSDFDTVLKSKTASVLKQQGYVLYSKLINSTIWKQKLEQ